ncbi:hypothetical protein [Amycolatopsis sp. NPDC054798]
MTEVWTFALHSPDDPVSAARELSILVGLEAVERYRPDHRVPDQR